MRLCTSASAIHLAEDSETGPKEALWLLGVGRGERPDEEGVQTYVGARSCGQISYRTIQAAKGAYAAWRWAR